MPSIDWNRSTWSNDYDWSQMGEEWSQAWGSSETQWYVTLYPRLHRFLPAKSVLEIATGFGRWTKFLLFETERIYRGIDLSENCISSCKEFFKNSPIDCEFHVTDGFSLSMVADKKYDFIFSFDSLVHVPIDVLRSYISQILDSLLEDDGVCMLHHSNLKDSLNRNLITLSENKHYRDPDVSAEDITKIIEENNGKVLVQEKLSWGGSPLSDAMTLFCKKDSPYKDESVFIENDMFGNEISYAKKIFDKYRIANID